MTEGIISLKLFKKYRDKEFVKLLLRDRKVRQFCRFAYCTNEKQLDNFISLYLNSDKFVTYTIFLDEEIIGILALDMITEEVFYIMSKKYRRKGFMKEALKLFVEYEIEQKEFIFYVVKDNIASQKVIESLRTFGRVEKEIFDSRLLIYKVKIKREGS